MKAGIVYNKVNITPEEKRLVLALSRIRGIGPRIFAALLENFKNVKSVFSSNEEELQKIVNSEIVRSILSTNIQRSVDRYIKILRKAGVSFLTILDNEYPSLLKEVYDPPIILYYIGDFKPDDFKKCLSIVGTRKFSQYGEHSTHDIVSILVDAGFTVVSGMAFGIDRIAHQASINAGGRTIGVLSGRVDVPLPKANFKIYNDIIENGCLISERHLDQELVPGMFASRNRIVSGLSLGTIIIEGGSKSGALITARCALDQGREVFALPGNIYSSNSKGTNGLIKRGEAKLIQSADDVLEEFGFKLRGESQSKNTRLNTFEQRIFDTLIQGPKTLDEIAIGLNEDIKEITQTITMMELDKKVVKIEGERYVILR